MPCSTAAAKTKGLNAEPACRRAWKARLNRLSLKSRPPTSARTSPVSTSSTTTPAWR